jgi:hypothetical protein
MLGSSLKFATGALMVLAATAAPVSLRVTPATLAGAEPLIQLNRACGQQAFSEDAVAGPGCTIDLNQICETSHADYVGYRNN